MVKITDEKETNSSLLIFHNNFLIDKVQPFSNAEGKVGNFCRNAKGQEFFKNLPSLGTAKSFFLNPQLKTQSGKQQIFPSQNFYQPLFPRNEKKEFSDCRT